MSEFERPMKVEDIQVSLGSEPSMIAYSITLVPMTMDEILDDIEDSLRALLPAWTSPERAAEITDRVIAAVAPIAASHRNEMGDDQ